MLPCLAEANRIWIGPSHLSVAWSVGTKPSLVGDSREPVPSRQSRRCLQPSGWHCHGRRVFQRARPAARGSRISQREPLVATVKMSVPCSTRNDHPDRVNRSKKLVLSEKSYSNEPVPVFTSRLLFSTITLAESGSDGGNQPRSKARCDLASSKVANRVVTTSLHPVAASA